MLNSKLFHSNSTTCSRRISQKKPVRLSYNYLSRVLYRKEVKRNKHWYLHRLWLGAFSRKTQSFLLKITNYQGKLATHAKSARTIVNKWTVWSRISMIREKNRPKDTGFKRRN